MTWLPPNARRAAPGSWLRNRAERRGRPEDTFTCGVRVVEGAIAGESSRWSFRVSAADELVVDGVVTVQHGPRVRLRLRAGSSAARPGRRPDHVGLAAVELDSGAEVELSLPAGEAIRFGVDGL